MIASVAIIAVIAVVTVATAGTGTVVAAVAAGALQGAMIGAATGAVTGGIIGYASSGTLDGALNGATNGMLAGTITGAIGGGITGGLKYSASSAGNGSTIAKGTQNPSVKAAVEKGQAMHSQMDYGPNVLKEVKISPGNRVDGIDMAKRIIYELKPNNPQAIARGMSQLNRYTNAATQAFGGDWTGVLVLYK